MNTIDNRPRLAFGMQITPKAEALIITEAGNLIGKTANGVVVVRNRRTVNKPILENIKGLVNHKKTDDLTLDAFVDGTGRYHALVKFTKGTQLKRLQKIEHEGDTLSFVLSLIDKQKLKFAKTHLKERYAKAKVEAAKAFEFDKFVTSKKLQARFADDSTKLIPKLEGEHALEDLKKLILEAPERFVFKMVHEETDKNFGNSPFQKAIAERENNKFKLFVATKEYPTFEEFPLNYPKAIAVRTPSGGIRYDKNVYDIKADLLAFEKNVLETNHIAFQKEASAVIKAKKQLIAAFKKSKGMDFTNEAKNIILESNELTSKQLKTLSELANRESSKDFQLDMGKLGSHYEAIIKSKDGTYHARSLSSPTQDGIFKMLLDDYDMGRAEKVYAEISANNIARNQKIETIKALTNSDVYKNKFDEQTRKSLEPLNEAYNLDFPNFKDIVENTPKIKLDLAERDVIGDRVLKVAHEDYPKAGFMPLGNGSSMHWSLLNRTNASKINDFAQTTLKKAHEEAIKVDAVREDLANFFAQARASKNK